jgi:hypothetical protein
MPSFSNLSESQISDLVAFLHQQNRDDRLRFTYTIKNVAIGDAAAGKSYFQLHCASCHSPSGDLAGIASKYPADVLQQLWLSPGRAEPTSKKDAAASTVVVTLPSGREFSGKLAHLGEFNVSLYGSQGYRSFPITSGTKVQIHDPLAAHKQLLKHLTDRDMHNVTTYLETLK